MKRFFNKARQLITYGNLRRKSGFSNSDRPLEKIYQFHSEFNKLGLGADFKTNANPGTTPIGIFEGTEKLMFASNNYLGLSNDKNVIGAAQIALTKHGLGPGGSRFLCGNVDILEMLDRKTAELVGTEDAITFPTGYMANLAVFQASLDPLVGSLPFPRSSGVIFSDEYNHGSIIDGCRLSSAKKITFRHNDILDLERKLTEYSNCFPKMIVTEGVFTPHGDMAPLGKIRELAIKFSAILMVDDAHGIGVLGKKGGGSTEVAGLQGKIDILMGSFDKALGGMGGFLAGKKETIEYFRIASRPYVFSSSIPAVLAGGMIESINKCISGNHLRQQLFKNAGYLRTNLKKIGFRILGEDQLPVVLVYIGEENKSIEFANRIFNEGIYCPSFRWPAVPQGESRIRITPMTSHSQSDLDKLISVFSGVGSRMNII